MVSVNRLKTILKWGTINSKMVDFSFLFLFLRSCSCLRLFTLGVFGSEWQENVTGTILYGLCGIPRVFHISRHTLCNSQMQNSLYTGPVLIYMGRLHEQRTIQLPDSTSLFSFSQHTERCNEREWGKKRKLCERTAKQWNVWYRLGLWRWSTEPNVCMFVIKQVWIFHLREKARIFFLQQTLCFTVFTATASQTSIFSHLQAMTSSFHRVIFLEDRPFDCYMNQQFIEKWEGVVCGFAFSQIPSQCLNQLLKSNWEAFKETPTFFITALPQTLILFQSYSQAGEYL